MDTIFHVTTRQAWREALQAGTYLQSTRGRTLEQVGFIHCSLRHQVDRIAALVYGDTPELVVLEIDPALVESPIRLENLDGGDEQFPHVYGPLPVCAVRNATEYRMPPAREDH